MHLFVHLHTLCICAYFCVFVHRLMYLCIVLCICAYTQAGGRTIHITPSPDGVLPCPEHRTACSTAFYIIPNPLIHKYTNTVLQSTVICDTVTNFVYNVFECPSPIRCWMLPIKPPTFSTLCYLIAIGRLIRYQIISSS